MERSASSRMMVLLPALALLGGCAHMASEAKAAPEDAAEPQTMVVTGSHVPVPVDPATGQPRTVSAVRIYSQRDIVNTGTYNLGQALYLLMP